MKKSKRTKRRSPGKKNIWLYILSLLVAFCASAAVSYYYLEEKIVFESSVMADMEAGPEKAADKNREKGPGRLYNARGGRAAYGDAGVFRKDTSIVVVEDIIRKRMKPYGVNLLDLYFDRRGTVYIDFGGELKKNFSGDAFDELNIIAGLYKGIKTAVPGLKAIKILIEGREAESFGGHIDISRPIGGDIIEKVL